MLFLLSIPDYQNTPRKCWHPVPWGLQQSCEEATTNPQQAEQYSSIFPLFFCFPRKSKFLHLPRSARFPHCPSSSADFLPSPCPPAAPGTAEPRAFTSPFRFHPPPRSARGQKRRFGRTYLLNTPWLSSKAEERARRSFSLEESRSLSKGRISS